MIDIVQSQLQSTYIEAYTYRRGYIVLGKKNQSVDYVVQPIQ